MNRPKPITRRELLKSGAAMSTVLAASRASGAQGGAQLAFHAIGDWGHANSDQRAVANAMAAVADMRGLDFVISTGDNFYPDGLSGPGDEKFRKVFEEGFAARALDVPWHVVLGNHDHKGDVQAQIDCSAINPRWRMPARYRRHRETLDGSAADFFYLDTTPIVETHESWLRWWSDPARAQLEWLERELASSGAEWKIVVGHHPICSVGRHGSSPTLIEAVKPLLERYGAQVYINGHNHNLEHAVAGDVHYLTSGGGAKPSRRGANSGNLFFARSLGFMEARLSKAEMQVEFFDGAAQSLYRTVIPMGA